VQALLEVLEASGSPAKLKMIGEHAEVCATAMIGCLHTLPHCKVRLGAVNRSIALFRSSHGPHGFEFYIRFTHRNY